SGDAARGRARHGGRAPGRVRACEEADLDEVIGTETGHVVEFLVRVQEDARPLREAMDEHAEAFRLLERGLDAAWTFHARDLDPVLRAVREALRRGRQLAEGA